MGIVLGPNQYGKAETRVVRSYRDAGRHEIRDLSVTTEFAALVSQAAAPVDDVRGAAAYRRHAPGVPAGRTRGWAWADYVTEEGRG
jgi:hypothetical protein